LHVLILHDSKYGIETHILTLAKELEKLGHKSIITVTDVMPNDMFIARLLLIFVKSLVTDFFTAIKLMETIKKERINVIHVHSPRVPLILGYILSRTRRIPLVVTIHYPYSIALKMNLLYKKANKIIVISPEAKERMIQYGANQGKIVVIPNMIDIQKYAPTENKNCARDIAFKLINIGRIDAGKFNTTRIALRAMHGIIGKFPNVKLLVAGTGSRLPEIEELALEINKKLGKDAIKVLGHVPDVVEVLRQADMVIGVGRVAIEAMCCGKPVVVASTNSDGTITGGLITEENINEIKKCNFSGRNYSERIDSQRMCELVGKLFVDETYKKSLGQFGRDFAEKYLEAGEISRKIESIYQGSIAEYENHS
jgi:glycosyltransferase involved in cell wall biosynthesis